MGKILKWTPRVLVMIYIAFISLFSLDVFGEGYVWYEALGGFLIHMIPSFVLVALLILAWHKPRYGGIAFLVLAVAFTMFFNTYREIITFLLLTVPLVLIGVLFLLQKK
jgi:hypothetical protein